MLWILTAASLILSGAPSNDGRPEGLVLRAQTEHFAFYARRDQEIDAAGCERYLAEVARVLNQEVPDRIRYYRYRDPLELSAVTGTYAAGVTFPRAREIHSVEPFHPHEIVHAVASQLGEPGAFFHEGLAVALANRSRWRGRDVDALVRERAGAGSVSWIVEHFDSMEPDIAYPLAGSFVGALLRTYGGARLADFFRACAEPRANREAAFAQTFGQPLEAAGAAWRARLAVPDRRSAQRPSLLTNGS